MSEEELKELKKRVQEDPVLLDILKLLCFAKSTLTAAMLAKKLKIGRRTILKKMKTLKELGLVESRERFKGYTATKEAGRLMRV